MEDYPGTISLNISLVSEILDNNNFYLTNSSQIFQKWQEDTNIRTEKENQLFKDPLQVYIGSLLQPSGKIS